jgi:hypothetical protein
VATRAVRGEHVDVHAKVLLSMAVSASQAVRTLFKRLYIASGINLHEQVLTAQVHAPNCSKWLLIGTVTFPNSTLADAPCSPQLAP